MKETPRVRWTLMLLYIPVMLLLVLTVSVIANRGLGGMYLKGLAATIVYGGMAFYFFFLEFFEVIFGVKELRINRRGVFLVRRFLGVRSFGWTQIAIVNTSVWEKSSIPGAAVLMGFVHIKGWNLRRIRIGYHMAHAIQEYRSEMIGAPLDINENEINYEVPLDIRGRSLQDRGLIIGSLALLMGCALTIPMTFVGFAISERAGLEMTFAALFFIGLTIGGFKLDVRGRKDVSFTEEGIVNFGPWIDRIRGIGKVVKWEEVERIEVLRAGRYWIEKGTIADDSRYYVQVVLRNSRSFTLGERKASELPLIIGAVISRKIPVSW